VATAYRLTITHRRERLFQVDTRIIGGDRVPRSDHSRVIAGELSDRVGIPRRFARKRISRGARARARAMITWGAKRTLAYQFLLHIRARQWRRIISQNRECSIVGCSILAFDPHRRRVREKGGWRRETSIPDSRESAKIPASILFLSIRAAREPARRSRFDIFRSASSRSYSLPPFPLVAPERSGILPASSGSTAFLFVRACREEAARGGTGVLVIVRHLPSHVSGLRFACIVTRMHSHGGDTASSPHEPGSRSGDEDSRLTRKIEIID